VDRLTCPRVGCGQEITPTSLCCPSCYRLIPAAIRFDIEACVDSRRAWTRDELWQASLAAALEALARTVITRAAAGCTCRARRRGTRCA
jgi:hypothetical protein